MPKSLRSKIKHLCYKGELNERERDRILDALDVEPCEDCISREELINELKLGYFNKDLQEGKNDPCVIDAMIDWAIRTIKSQPSVTPKAKWIPCSEMLPEKQDCYLVTTKWKGSYSGDVYIETNMAVYKEKQKEWDCNDVIAWMPLPEPYKAESEE